MAVRPDTTGSRPFSVESVGIASLALQSDMGIAEEVTSAMVANVLNTGTEHHLLMEDLRGAQASLEEAHKREEDLRRQLAELAAEVERLSETPRPSTGPRRDALEEECRKLRDRVSYFESKEAVSTMATMELPTDSSEEQTMLAAAYQQIALLNTQLAHLYTELTMARTEAQHLRSTRELGGSGGDTNTAERDGEVQKQSQQIADLVGDIRHLQLDLEYHQQKLDQMIEEKQQMMKDLKQCRADLAATKQLAEEREQMLRHREVDLQHLRQEMKSPRGGVGGSVDEGVLTALRTEAAAKDSALIVSHYELHKEKLMRDRLEQKNAKLMERMQKLMMVVETMRRDNLSLEKLVAAKEKAQDEKECQLRQAMLKAKQLQKVAGKTKSRPVELTLQCLPPV